MKQLERNNMKQLEITPQTLVRTKGFDISIGKETHQVAIISHSTGEFTPFKVIVKGGRLAKIKRKFKRSLSSSTYFFFEFMSIEDTKLLIGILK